MESIFEASLDSSAVEKQETQSSLGLGRSSIPNVKWDDVGGLEDVKDEILDMVCNITKRLCIL